MRQIWTQNPLTLRRNFALLFPNPISRLQDDVLSKDSASLAALVILSEDFRSSNDEYLVEVDIMIRLVCYEIVLFAEH